MLTLGDILDEVRIALRHGVDARLNEARFVNRVGRRWVSLHSRGGWRYLAGRSTILTTVPQQQAYDLPLDYRKSEAKFSNDGGIWPLHIVNIISPEEWHGVDVRDFGAVYGRFLGYVNHDTRADGETFGPVLYLTPIPSDERELRIVYEAGWKPLALESDVADIPEWAEEPFLTLARRVAHALHRPSMEGHPDPMPQLIREFKLSDDFQDAMTQDGMVEPDIPMGVGVMQEIAWREGKRRWIGPRWTNQDLLADL